jgi:hypothetical protein
VRKLKAAVEERIVAGVAVAVVAIVAADRELGVGNVAGIDCAVGGTATRDRFGHGVGTVLNGAQASLQKTAETPDVLDIQDVRFVQVSGVSWGHAVKAGWSRRTGFGEHRDPQVRVWMAVASPAKEDIAEDAEGLVGSETVLGERASCESKHRRVGATEGKQSEEEE